MYRRCLLLALAVTIQSVTLGAVTVWGQSDDAFVPVTDAML